MQHIHVEHHERDLIKFETMSKQKNQSRRNFKRNPKKLKQVQKDAPKRAIVKTSISPIIRAGDVLVKKTGGNVYVKQGERPEMIDCVVRFGWFGLKKMTVSSPNFYRKEHVEHLPSYFRIMNQ